MTRVAVVTSIALVTGAFAFTTTGRAFAPQVRDVAAPQNQPTDA